MAPKAHPKRDQPTKIDLDPEHGFGVAGMFGSPIDSIGESNGRIELG